MQADKTATATPSKRRPVVASSSISTPVAPAVPAASAAASAPSSSCNASKPRATTPVATPKQVSAPVTGSGVNPPLRRAPSPRPGSHRRPSPLPSHRQSPRPGRPPSTSAAPEAPVPAPTPPLPKASYNDSSSRRTTACGSVNPCCQLVVEVSTTASAAPATESIEPPVEEPAKPDAAPAMLARLAPRAVACAYATRGSTGPRATRAATTRAKAHGHARSTTPRAATNQALPAPRREC